MQKSAILLLILLLAAPIVVMVRPADADIAAPATPQFTLRYEKATYNTIDPYTGVTQQVDNSTITIVVKNQPFNTIYNAIDNITTSLYYNVQFKGHYSKSWIDAFSSTNYTYPMGDWVYTMYDYPIQSNSDFTTIPLPSNYPPESQVDFRVQAVIANLTQVMIPNFIPNPIRGGEYTRETVMYIVQTSDWTSTRTITIGDHSYSLPMPSPPATTSPSALASQTPTAMPNQQATTAPIQPSTDDSASSRLDWAQIATLVLLGFIAAMLVVVAVLLHKRSRKN